ncbi:hypothetical protein E5083_26085 [Streptomyces bauhiniae]|uniref:Uncharacterized protein n=1 Tax=Streptomyces bauhiniae TaxID=2340725 RepID=A0A4Z1CW53_9ACTN|nr:hypothetical protein [Streptomyces bauhiniae]TGN73133.1 hypothetical protein E5083_26085 [Streptomyces bauhiniae]
MRDDQQILDLLRSLDRLPGPDHTEFPDGFDYQEAEARAAALSERLSDEFAGPCSLDVTQDASYYFMVSVPAALTEAGVSLGIRLSNYGRLAAVTTPLPDSHADLDDAVADGALSAVDRRRVETALAELGCRIVPLRLLHLRYDGVTWLADDVPGASVLSYGPYAGEATWWTRFFEHL